MMQLLRAQAYKRGSPLNQVRVNADGKAKEHGRDSWNCKANTTLDDWLGWTDT